MMAGHSALARALRYRHRFEEDQRLLVKASLDLLEKLFLSRQSLLELRDFVALGQ